MLIDEVQITLKAGDGGRGKISFGKMAKSGPDGGNGGDGGDIYLLASSDLTLLSQFASKEKVVAEDGIPGDKDKKNGKNGKDLVLNFPVGSMFTDTETGETFELNKIDEKILICKGGAGGTGNFDLRSSTNVTPLNNVPPTKGQERYLKIILRFIADYGLIGLPSAGKSSLINELTNANVKTAEYHFTTLSANLGVLPTRKIIADIPGLIEGASVGKGLGTKFLKHIQKVSLLLHCISTESRNPTKDYQVIRTELASFDKKLLKKKEVILVTKSDLVDKEKIEKITKELKRLNKNIIPTSIHDVDSINAIIANLIHYN